MEFHGAKEECVLGNYPKYESTSTYNHDDFFYIDGDKVETRMNVIKSSEGLTITLFVLTLLATLEFVYKNGLWYKMSSRMRAAALEPSTPDVASVEMPFEIMSDFALIIFWFMLPASVASATLSFVAYGDWVRECVTGHLSPIDALANSDEFGYLNMKYSTSFGVVGGVFNVLSFMTIFCRLLDEGAKEKEKDQLQDQEQHHL